MQLHALITAGSHAPAHPRTLLVRQNHQNTPIVGRSARHSRNDPPCPVAICASIRLSPTRRCCTKSGSNASNARPNGAPASSHTHIQDSHYLCLSCGRGRHRLVPPDKLQPHKAVPIICQPPQFARRCAFGVSILSAIYPHLHRTSWTMGRAASVNILRRPPLFTFRPKTDTSHSGSRFPSDEVFHHQDQLFSLFTQLQADQKVLDNSRTHHAIQTALRAIIAILQLRTANSALTASLPPAESNRRRPHSLYSPWTAWHHLVFLESLKAANLLSWSTLALAVFWWRVGSSPFRNLRMTGVMSRWKTRIMKQTTAETTLSDGEDSELSRTDQWAWWLSEWSFYEPRADRDTWSFAETSSLYLNEAAAATIDAVAWLDKRSAESCDGETLGAELVSMQQAASASLYQQVAQMDPSEFGLTSRGEALWQIQRLNERLWRKLSWPSPGMGETAAPSSSGELMLWSLVDELVPPRGWVTGSSGYVLPVGDGIWLSLALRRRAAQDPCGSVDLLERCIYAVESAVEFMVSQSVFTATSSVRVMSLPLPHPRVWNAVLDTLMRAGHVENAFKLFDRWRGQKACTWAVTRSGESGEVRVELKPNLAGDRFSRLKQKQSKYYTQNRFVRTVQRDPDQTTYMILASGCIRNEKWEDFDNILSLARSSNKISVKESLESSDEGSSRGDAVTASILLRSQDRMHVLWDFLQVQNAMEQGHFDSAWRILRKAVERFKSAAGISLPLESASHFGGRRQQKDLALLQAATVLRECFGVMITGFAKRGFLTSVDAVLSELSDLRAASTGAAGGKKMVWSDQLALRVRNVLAFVDAFCSLNRLSDAAATLQKVFASKAESRLYDLAVGLEVLYRGCRTAVVRQRQWESTAAKELVQAESDPPGSTPARGADEVFRQSLTLFLDLVSRDIEATFPASLPTTARAAEEPTVADRRNGGGTVSGTVAGARDLTRGDVRRAALSGVLRHHIGRRELGACETILAMSIDPLAAAEQAVGVSFGHDGGAAGAGAARALHDSHPLDGVLVSDELLEELARAYESEGQQAEADAVRREMRWRGRRMGNDRVGNAGRGLPNLREDGAFADVMELEETLQSWSGK